MAQFFQDTLQQMAKEKKKLASKRVENADEVEKEEEARKEKQSAAAMLDFLNKARSGERMPSNVIVQFASHFADDLTLDNMPRMQLINMCRYMNIAPYGSDNFLRFQLRHNIRSLVEDDARILWEGIDSLTKMELREACQERGMRSTGLSKDAYKRLLQEWLDLSVNKNVPISLLIMSRIFFLRDEFVTRKNNDEQEQLQQQNDNVSSKAVAGLADAISGLDQDIVNEVVLEVATAEESKSDPEIQKLKLEVLEAQNERILEEQKERDAAEKAAVEAITEAAAAAAAAEESSSTTESIPADGSTFSGAPTDKPVETMQIVDSSSSDEVETEKQQADEDKEYLSTQEMDAISQLINADPLELERADLDRIKSAMAKAEEDGETDELDMIKASIEESQRNEESYDISEIKLDSMLDDEARPSAAVVTTTTAEEADKIAAATIQEMDEASAREAEATTTMDLDMPAAATTKEEEEEPVADWQLDRTIEGLKARVSRMVNKIESQLDTVEEKIGDKLHFLDKDGDGVMSLDEMAHALQLVLKRELTHEEAMAIAALMDENKDGVFTVDEFSRWIETNKIVQLVKKGQDGDLDRLLSKHSDEEDQEPKETRNS